MELEDHAQEELAPPTTIGRLLYYASKGDVQAVNQVLDDSPGMPVDAQDYDGRTAMHLAASEGHSGVILLLLDRGANVNPVDRWRKTPLADARRYEVVNRKGSPNQKIYEEVCNLLVAKGGSTSSPFEIAERELTYTADVRQCTLGRIKLANWRGTTVQARVMSGRVAEQSCSPKCDPNLTKQLSLLQRLRHPNIVQFLGAVQTKSQPLVLITEYLPKGNLQSLLQESKNGRIPLKEAMNYALDIARGMNYLHQHKPVVVHCDLNPKNLVRDDGGHLKVAGLHLSEIESICKFGNRCLDQPGFRYYSSEQDVARYRAPELIEAPAIRQTSVDVYSFGMIIREMFVGRRFASRPAQSKLIPLPMEKLLQRCCHKEARHRPPFDKIISELEKIQGALKSKTFCGAMEGIVYGLSYKFCFSQEKYPPKYKSRLSLIHSIESHKGAKHYTNGEAAHHTSCTRVPE